MFKKGDRVVLNNKSVDVVKDIISELTFKSELGDTLLASYIKGFEDKKIEKERLKEFYEQHKDLVISPEAVLKVVEDIYGKNRVQVKRMNLLGFDIIIHFPELEITNSKKRKHTIKDLYVKLEIRGINPTSYYKCSLHMWGLRTTFTLKEINSNYSHSHLQTSHPGDWTGFCLGGNSSLQILIENLRMELKEEQWYLFFYTLESYLKWESLEGGPFHRMENIVYGTRVQEKESVKELARIIEDSPREMWGYTDRLEIIDSHPSYEEFLDGNSKIRKLSLYDEAKIKKDMKTLRTKLPEKFSFNRKKVDYNIIRDVATVDDVHVQKEVMDKYVELVNDNLETYSKTLEYERRKKEEGEVGSISFN